MIALKYTITTEQPLLITSLQGDPNSSVSFDYIPGSAIRGALIGLYQQQNKDIVDLLADDLAKRLFFSSQTRFLNGYCAIGEARCLPLPKSLRSKKRAEPREGLWDSSTEEYHKDVDSDVNKPKDEAVDKKRDKSEHRSFKGRFGWLDSAQTLHIPDSVKTVLNIHTARDRQKGRATSGSGAVFRYEAIAPGQCFIGYILCELHADAAEIQKLLNQPFLWLGGSRSAGYGKVLIEFESVSDWTESVTPKIDSSLNTITLLSDMLIRDQQGQYTTDLAGKLGLELIPERSNITSTIIGGFNRKWGLPLPQVPAIAMGSVFVVQDKDKGKVEPNYQFWLEQGIGERRNEGFGRIAINWRPQTDGQGKFTPLVIESKPKSTDSEHPTTQPTTIPSKSAVDEQLNLIKERIIRQRLDQRLVTLAQTYMIDTESITSTQLARLWLTARNSIGKKDLEKAESYDEIKKLINDLPSNVKGQFERAYSEKIGWDSDLNLPETLAIPSELRDEYTLRLVMSVAKQARNQLTANKPADGAPQQ